MRTLIAVTSSHDGTPSGYAMSIHIFRSFWDAGGSVRSEDRWSSSGGPRIQPPVTGRAEVISRPRG
jgi:hypothetical protein